ncbi:hypothetical protein B7463_g3107, partial [Scytalidium lignicola]
MTVPRSILISLGVFALLSEAVLLILNLIFAITLADAHIRMKIDEVEIVATVLSFINTSLLSILLARQFRYRDGAHIQDFGHGRQHTYLLAGLCGVFCTLSASATVVGLGVIKSRTTELPHRTLNSSTKDLASGALVIWVLSLISQAVFIVAIVLIQRSDFHKQVQPFQTESASYSLSAIKDTVKNQVRSLSENGNQSGSNSLESKSPPPSSGKSSMRNSLSLVVRPITTKAKLISGNQTPAKRPESLDSGYRDGTSSIEDGFDSWDTSAVEPHYHQAVLGTSSPNSGFLETIPASPTDSRSPSPGHPLELDSTSITRPRGRSHSPAPSRTEITGNSSPVPSLNGSLREAHIHPLFRSDSPTPPPAATPGTVVTAAPGAGQVISDRQSIVSLNRIRSGSLPSRSLGNSPSLDSIRRAMEKEDREKIDEEIEEERKMTPPIPEWILSQGPRSSLTRGMSNRSSRRNTPNIPPSVAGGNDFTVLAPAQQPCSLIIVEVWEAVVATMKLTFKDLKQQKFVIEAEPTELISDVKEKIAKEKGWEASQQKLIYSGKILQDGNTVESYKIEEKGFIVCMIQKPKAAPPAAASASKAPSTPAPAQQATPAPPLAPEAVRSSAPVAPSTPSPAGASTVSAPTAPAGAQSSGLAIGAERAAQVQEMESMGFERSQIDLAMRAAFYNSERAIEYLLTGIPENLLQEHRQAQSPATSAQAPTSPSASGGAGEGVDEPVNLFEAAATAGQGGSGRGGSGNIFGAGAGAGAGAGGLGNLDFLRNNPQFQQLRQVVQQQPQMLEPILQQVSAGNPQLAQLIGQHPDQFLQLLSEDGDNDAPLPPGAQAISVTEEEREAIERLCRLGFPRDQAIQAYFACDKNEELAANFLFEQPEDEE